MDSTCAWVLIFVLGVGIWWFFFNHRKDHYGMDPRKIRHHRRHEYEDDDSSFCPSGQTEVQLCEPAFAKGCNYACRDSDDVPSCPAGQMPTKNCFAYGVCGDIPYKCQGVVG